MFSASSGVAFFDNKTQLKSELGLTIFDKDNTVKLETEKEIYMDFQLVQLLTMLIYDVHRKLALFTKSIKSKSLYCAGYYIIQFDKGWVKSFCPKLITLERYNYKGPFKTIWKCDRS